MKIPTIPRALPAAALAAAMLVPTASTGTDSVMDHTGTPLDFSLPTAEGETFTLSEHRGEKVLAIFWASW